MSAPLNVTAILVAEGKQDADVRGLFAAVRNAVSGAAVQVNAIIVGTHPEDHLARQALAAGAASVSLVSHPHLAEPAQADQLLTVLVPLLQSANADLVVLHAESMGDELAARLAIRMDGQALGRCSALQRSAAGWVARKPAYGGRLEAQVEAGAGPCFAVLHATSLEAGHAVSAGEGGVQRLTLTSSLPGVEHIRHTVPALQRKRLEGARIVVCGGRGMGGPEGFTQLQLLADALGAALGGSLPAVDAGWAPVSHQIGQSGKYVAPAIYVAVGVSGTPQHMAGVAPHADIVAINSDEDADIFRVAKAGAVADWKELLPALIRALQRV